MMLVTFTRAPPSCSARLPQTCSAATTLITAELPAEPVRARLGEVAQPASATGASTAASTAPATRTPLGGNVKNTANPPGRLLSRHLNENRTRYQMQQPGRPPPRA